MYHEISACRVCANTELHPVLHLGEQTLTGVFPRFPDQRISRGPLELVKCHGGDACGLVQLRQSYSCQEMYGDNYGYRSSLNKAMVQHLHTKAASLARLIELRPGDLILDIGSNDGTFLAGFPAPGCTLVGIDPSAAKFAEYYRSDIVRIPQFFTADTFKSQFGTKKAKVVTSISMFYDLESPLGFAQQIRDILADDGIWHLEQSYLPLMISRNAYDTVCHEHLEYYALQQIQWIADRSGMKILDVSFNDTNGGSFAVTLTPKTAPYRPDQKKIDRMLTHEVEQGTESLPMYERFRHRVFRHRDELCDLLATVQKRGQRVAGYGASTKGNVVLQFCGITTKQVVCIADVNVDKHGCMTPGTLIPIQSEDAVRATKPDYFLVLPWHFRAALVARERDWLQAGGQMVFPLPAIEIVGADPVPERRAA